MEKLLEIRSFTEKERSLELAEVTGRYLKRENAIKDLILMRKQILKDRYNSADNNIAADSVFLDTQVSAVREKISLLEKELSVIGKEMESVRKRYITALKEKKVLEKLKEKKMSEHRKGETAKEAKALDDISVTSYTVRIQEV